MSVSQTLPTTQQIADHEINTKNRDIWFEGVSHAAESSTLNLILRLCQTLDREKITYCHWKSNAALDRSAAGDNDLDLLVGRSDAERFSEILYRLGFKQAQAPREQEMPGVLDYYGHDDGADRPVHVHAHYQLVLGHDLTKNYRLSIETPYLSSAVRIGLFKVPAPEFEFVVFVIRMVLKHSTWDSMLIKHGRLSASEQHELAYLQERVDEHRVRRILQQHLPYIKEDLFDICVQALQPGCPLWAKVKAGHHLQRALRAQTRRSQLQDTVMKFWRRFTWGVRRRFFNRVPKRRLGSGGAIVAFVGGDGAGKSTAIEGVHKWLNKDLDVFRVHLGKPAWSRTTTLVRGLLRLGRSLGLYQFVTTASILYADDTGPYAPHAGYPVFIRAVCTARDRYLEYCRAKRFASTGGLVLCDRFPLPHTNMVDGPLIEQLVHPEHANWFVKLLIKSEKRYYRQISWPELLVVLKLNPEIAVQRKTDEDAPYVRARSKEMWAFDWRQIGARVIDASQSREEVLSELKSTIWLEL